MPINSLNLHHNSRLALVPISANAQAETTRLVPKQSRCTTLIRGHRRSDFELSKFPGIEHRHGSGRWSQDLATKTKYAASSQHPGGKTPISRTRNVPRPVRMTADRSGKQNSAPLAEQKLSGCEKAVTEKSCLKKKLLSWIIPISQHFDIGPKSKNWIPVGSFHEITPCGSRRAHCSGTVSGESKARYFGDSTHFSADRSSPIERIRSLGRQDTTFVFKLLIRECDCKKPTKPSCSSLVANSCRYSTMKKPRPDQRSKARRIDEILRYLYAANRNCISGRMIATAE